MSIQNRCVRYAAMAALPTVVGGAHAGAYDQYSTTPITIGSETTATIASSNGLQVIVGFGNSNVYFNVNGGPTSFVGWWVESSQTVNLNWPPSGAAQFGPGSFTQTADTGASHYVGWGKIGQNWTPSTGWIQYEVAADYSYMTVLSWATANFNINMPAAGSNSGGGGGGAVPGLGGLAALACGAAGVRRNRHRGG